MAATTIASPRLVLAGLGHAQIFVLEQFAAWRASPQRAPRAVLSALTEGRVSLMAPSTDVVYSGMVPGMIAGRFSAADVTLKLAGLIERSGVRFLPGTVLGLDATAKTLRLLQHQHEHEWGFDLLSLNTGGTMTRQACDALIPGSGAMTLQIRPMQRFVELWPQLVAQAQDHAHAGGEPYHLAVIGAGAGGMEIAMAAAKALPAAVVSLLAGPRPVGSWGGEGFAQRVRAALQRSGVHVLPLRARSMRPSASGTTEVSLDGGAQLICHASVLATGSMPAPWLADSGLALDRRGFVAVQSTYESASHPGIWATGDMASCVDAQLPRSGVAAVRAGPALAQNIAMALSGLEQVPHRPQSRYLYLLSTADGRAIAQWGGLALSGRALLAWKDHIDRRFVARFSR